MKTQRLVLLLHQAALSAVGTVGVVGHEDSGAAGGALLTKTGDLVLISDLVELEDGELDGLVLVGDTLGGVVDLLLSLLGSSAKAKNQVESGLLLDVVVRKGAAILELLTGKDKALLIRGDTYDARGQEGQKVSATARREEIEHTRTHGRVENVKIRLPCSQALAFGQLMPEIDYCQDSSTHRAPDDLADRHRRLGEPFKLWFPSFFASSYLPYLGS